MPMGYEQNMNPNATTSAGVAPLFQPALNRNVIRRAKRKFYHMQFGQKGKIAKMEGKGTTIVWDRPLPLPKATTPLTEGITPRGSAVNITRITAPVLQYGNYITYTDRFDFFKIDPPPQAIKYSDLLGENAGETLDYIAALALNSGTNVQYAGGKTARASLTTSDVLTVDDVRKAVRTIKGNNGKRFNDSNSYIALIHTDVAYDIADDKKWTRPHEYKDTKAIYEGEIGMLYGVRFIETPDALVFYGDPILGYDELSVIRTDGRKIYVAEEITAAAVSALGTGRKILVNGIVYTVSSATAGQDGEGYITLSANVSDSIEPGMKVHPGEGGADGKPVYSTLVFGMNAFGTSDPKEINIIMHPVGSAGSADPLDQRGTAGWKAEAFAKILANEYLVRIESAASRY